LVAQKYAKTDKYAKPKYAETDKYVKPKYAKQNIFMPTTSEICQISNIWHKDMPVGNTVAR